MKTLLTFLFCANSLLATAQTTPPKDSVLFECPKCDGNMKLIVSGNGTNMTYERKSTERSGTLFPITTYLAPGNYVYSYQQNGVDQMKLPFTVKAGEPTIVTVK